MEKNYVYLYQDKGMYHNPVMSFQAPVFALELSAEEKIGLSKIGFSDFINTGKFAGENELIPVECKFFLTENGKKINVNGTKYCYTSDKWYWSAYSKYRIIEAGRFFNKVDIMDVTFDDDRLSGRFEATVTPVSFTCKFDCYSKVSTRGTISFEISFPTYYKISASGKKAVISCDKGTFYVYPFNCDVSTEGNKLVFNGTEREITNRFDGIGFTAYTSDECDRGVSVSVKGLGEVTASAPYRDEYGVNQIDLKGNENLDFTKPADRNVYDEVEVVFENRSNEEKIVPVCFRRSGMTFPVVGMSPLWKDENGDPDGTPVQLTKDWHIHPDEKECGEWFAIPLDATRRYYEGKWSHLYSYVALPARSVVKKTFVCAFENWGKYPASSHAQLSLIGWGGYGIWEQLAIGSHSENICFAMDGTSNIGVIQDIRPLYLRGKHGGFADYGWSDNVGGGEFLYYVDINGTRRDFARVITDFKAHCPVLTDTEYEVTSSDGKISAKITINQPATDDILKEFFKIKYTFNEDVEYERLCLFQFDSDRYLANVFTQVAVGNSDVLKREFSFKPDFTFESGSLKGFENITGAENDWFFFHGMPNEGSEEYEKLDDGGKTLKSGKNANILFTVREVNGVVNGKPYELIYGLRQCYSTDRRHVAVEIKAASEKLIKKGSEAEFLIELNCIPASIADYYGNCEYIKKLGDVLDGVETAKYVSARSIVSGEATEGELVSLYPVRVRCAGDSATIKLIGGLGVTPVSFEGLSGYSGYEITCNGKAVDNSVKGKDYLQVYRGEDGKYTLSVGIEASKEQRIIKIARKR